MSKLGYIQKSYGTNLEFGIANTYGYNILSGSNLPVNSIIIASPVDENNNDLGSYTLLATDYKGGVSDTFNETVLDLKPFFTRQYETLNEFCSTINTAADNIDEKQQNAAAAAQGLGI